MPTKRADGSAAVADGKLYVMGGWSWETSPLDTVEILGYE